MIMRYVLLEDMTEGAFTKEHQLREALLLHGAPPPFRVGIQIRRTWRQLDGLHTGILKHGQELGREQWVSIMNEVAFAIQNPVDSIGQIPVSSAQVRPV